MVGTLLPNDHPTATKNSSAKSQTGWWLSPTSLKNMISSNGLNIWKIWKNIWDYCSQLNGCFFKRFQSTNQQMFYIGLLAVTHGKSHSCQQNAMPIPYRNYWPSWMQAPKRGCGHTPLTISLVADRSQTRTWRWNPFLLCPKKNWPLYACVV